MSLESVKPGTWISFSEWFWALLQGAYNSGKPGKLWDFLILENSGKFEIYSGNFW